MLIFPPICFLLLSFFSSPGTNCKSEVRALGGVHQSVSQDENIQIFFSERTNANPLKLDHNLQHQVRSGMGACGGTAHHCVNFLPASSSLRLAIPQADAWPIPISLRCRSTCCNHEARCQPIGLLYSRDSLTERIWSAGLAPGKRTTC